MTYTNKGTTVYWRFVNFTGGVVTRYNIQKKNYVTCSSQVSCYYEAAIV